MTRKIAPKPQESKTPGRDAKGRFLPKTRKAQAPDISSKHSTPSLKPGSMTILDGLIQLPQDVMAALRAGKKVQVVLYIDGLGVTK